MTIIEHINNLIMEKTTIRITTDVRDCFNRFCKRNGYTGYVYAEKALMEYIKRHDKKHKISGN
jgi:predicted transcriptional regulator